MLMRIQKSAQTMAWAIKIALSINTKTFICWFSLTGLLSVLPALSLGMLQRILTNLSLPGTNMHAVFFEIGVLGIIMIVVGLSSRLNTDLLYMVMYDSYYLGMMERIIDFTQLVDIEQLMDKDLRDEYTAATLRAGALNDFISSLCALLGKGITIISLLIFAYRESLIIFFLSLLFCMFTVVIDIKLTEGMRVDIKKMRPLESRCDYFEKLPLQPGVAKEIRLFGMQDATLSQWKAALQPILTANIERETRSEKHSLYISLIFYVSFSLIMLMSIMQLEHGTIFPSSTITIFTYGFQMFTALQAFSKMVISVDNGLFSLERQKTIFEKFIQKDSMSDGCSESDEDNIVFDLREVSYTYPNGTKAVDGISFTVKAGELIAIVGDNGSGKSTLINLLLGVLSPKEGDMYYKGRKYGSFAQEILHNDIGVFFQEYTLFHKTIRENVGFGDVKYIEDNGRIQEALQQGDAEAFVNKLPQKEETYVGRRVEKSGVDFSGGEKQKIGVSRANMSNKEILFFDEPSSMLDPLAELRQLESIKNKLQGRTAILVSHRMGFAKDASKIIVLHHGRIVGCGDHRTLLSCCSRYRDMYYAQAQWYEEEACIEEL